MTSPKKIFGNNIQRDVQASRPANPYDSDDDERLTASTFITDNLYSEQTLSLDTLHDFYICI